jgi:hypothetical protein
MGADKMDFLRKVKQVGARGAHFQFREVRDALGLDAADKNANSQLHNFLKSLIREEIVDVVPSPGRKRNKYFRVADEEKLRQRLGVRAPAPNGEGRAPAGLGSPGDRLARIEASLQSVIERLDSTDAKISELLTIWA